MKLDLERFNLFLEALRSGRSLQGHGYLEQVSPDTGNTLHCCLGVATRLAMEHGVEVGTETVEETGGDGRCFTRFNGTGAYMPGVVCDWYGFSEDNPTLDVEDLGRHTAVACNDTLRLSFTQIADAFERTYLQDLGSGVDHLG